MSTTTLSVVAATMSLLPSWLRSPPATHRIAGERLVCYDLPVWHVFLALEPALDGEAQLLAGLRPQTLRQGLRRDGNERPGRAAENRSSTSGRKGNPVTMCSFSDCPACCQAMLEAANRLTYNPSAAR